MLDRLGHIFFLDDEPATVKARVGFVGTDSTVVHLTVGDQEFELVVGLRRGSRDGSGPIILNFPA
jgi:hypothetical protein